MALIKYGVSWRASPATNLMTGGRESRGFGIALDDGGEFVVKGGRGGFGARGDGEEERGGGGGEEAKHRFSGGGFDETANWRCVGWFDFWAKVSPKNMLRGPSLSMAHDMWEKLRRAAKSAWCWWRRACN